MTFSTSKSALLNVEMNKSLGFFPNFLSRILHFFTVHLIVKYYTMRVRYTTFYNIVQAV